MATIVTLITRAEYARRRGVSRSAVTKAVRAGRITLIDGRIDPAVADVQWARNTDPQQMLRATRGRLPQAPLLVPAPRAAGSEDREYSDARRRRDAALAELAEHELQAKRRTLVAMADVERGLVDRVARLGQALDALARHLAEPVAAEADPAKVYALIRAEVRATLKALAASGDSGRVS